MNAIQTRLTVYLLACVLAMSAMGSLAVYVVFRERMMAQFDDALRADARTIAGYFSRDHDGRYEFKPPPDMGSVFRHDHDRDAYCIRRMDGAVVVHAPWIKPQDCPGLARPATWEGSEPVEAYPGLDQHDNSNWRAVWLLFHPASETGMPVDRFQVVVAAEWEETNELLNQLIAVLAAVAAVAGAATVLSVVWTVRRGLSPLRLLARQAERIDPAHPDMRFSLDEPSRELQPIHRALNQLLDRVRDALRREQRFNADVAHELRTPVAELRSLTEVALASRGNPAILGEALDDAHGIAVQMEAMIAALLALHRRTPPVCERVDAVAAIRKAWQPSAFAARGIAFSWQMPQEAFVLGDPAMLLSVLQNLFRNAANYTAAGGAAACAVAVRGGVTEITIRNRPHGLGPGDLAHLFEPFWRKEAARSDGTHVGLGLSLAETCCQAMGGTLRAEFTGEDWLAFIITLPSCEAAD